MDTNHRAPITVVPYRESWAEDFRRLYDYLWPALEGAALAVEHVGSTSVPGLYAKPIIDLDVVIAGGFNEVRRRLESLGYVYEGELDVPGREAFDYRGAAALPPQHLYVCEKTAGAYLRHIALRDYLRAHPEAAAEYSRIKREGAALYPYDIDAYLSYKGGFIEGIYKICNV